MVARTLQFDAQDFLDSACEMHELDEDASDIPEELIDELQLLLEAWAAKVEDITRTFYPNFDIPVTLD